ncbi:hypothetical protein BH11CYA1_BH11CYA1_45540 [soil metagenome]
MPSLLCYLTEADLAPVVQFLNDSDKIAFIVPDVPGRWIAISTIDALNLKSYVLWHIPSGALPLIHPGAPNTQIHDPWSGWQEDQSFEDGSSPYFGAGHPGIVWLKGHAPKLVEI